MGPRYCWWIPGQKNAEILGTGQMPGRTPRLHEWKSVAAKSLARAGTALFFIHAAPASAVGLGEIQLQSGIGDRLRAVVPMQVGDGETLSSYCIKTARGTTGLRAPENLKIIAPAATQPGEYLLHISTPRPLHEPMYEFSIIVDCPNVSMLERHYSLMLNLPGTALPELAAESSSVAVPVPGTIETPLTDETASMPVVELTNSDNDILPGTRYRIREGDTLGTIAKRILGRPPDTIWNVAQLVYATNLHAFVANDAGLIKLGSILRIPDEAGLASFNEPAAEAFRSLRATKLQPAQASTAVSVPAQPTPPDFDDLTTRNAAVEEAVFEAEQISILPAPETIVAEPPAPRAMAEQPTETVSATSNRIFAEAPPAKTPTLTGDESARLEPTTTNPIALEMPASVDSVPEPAAELTEIPLPPASVAQTRAVAPANDVLGTLLAVGTGILLGCALSLILLRKRLLAALGDMVPRRRNVSAVVPKRKPDEASTQNQASERPSDSHANAIISEASEFLDTLAGEAFQTNDTFAKTGLIPVGNPEEDTYIVEVATGTSEPTLREMQALPEDADAGPEAIDPSDDSMMAHLFDEKSAESHDVIDPSADFSAQSVFETGATEIMPENASIDPTAEMPAPAADEERSTQAEESNEIFEMNESTLSQAFSTDLENLDPQEMFETSRKIIETEDSPTENLLTEALTEIGLGEPLDEIADEDTLSNTLNAAMSLLETEYEDEFTESQILERTAIKEALSKKDEKNSKEESSGPPGRTRTG